MDFITYVEKIAYLLEMITKEQALSPAQIAKKFNCCDKTARNMINILRLQGNNIKYDRQTSKYLIVKN